MRRSIAAGVPLATTKERKCGNEKNDKESIGRRSELCICTNGIGRSTVSSKRYGEPAVSVERSGGYFIQCHRRYDDGIARR